MAQIDKIIEHIRDRPYMGGVERDKLRIKATGEVFTPTWLVMSILDTIESKNPAAFSDPTNTFCDPTCGDGQFLGEVLIRKLQKGIDFEIALSTIYGVDIMPDNIKLCRERLLCIDTPSTRQIVNLNIVCEAGLTDPNAYNFSKLHTGSADNSPLFD